MPRLDKKDRMRYNGIFRGVKIIAFGACLALFFLIGLLWFARPAESEIEKRELSTIPAFTVSGFLDGSWFKGVDTWYSDTYPLREGLIAGSQWMQDHYGLRGEQIVDLAEAGVEIGDGTGPEGEAEAAPEIDISPDGPLADGTVNEVGETQGKIYITGNCGYGLYYFTQDGADTFIDTMNHIWWNHWDDIDNMYVMIAPQSASVMLGENVIQSMGSSSEKEAMEYVYSRLDPGITPVNVYDHLKLHNAEYIYFHTDHHWTQLGSYYAYQVFCKAKGIQFHELNEFQTMEFPGFLGTYYSSSNNSPQLAANPDTVYCWVPNGTNDMTVTATDGSTINWKIITDVSGWAKGGLYGAFVSGDRPFSVAHNPNITDGSSVMVIKDSYGNAFVPWLIDHYEYTYWVDYRYTWNTISQMVADYGVKDVIFEVQMYNATTKKPSAAYARIGQ